MQKKGFTLVELIVVITILAILGTIAFSYLAGYSSSARDSIRVTDVSSIMSTVDLFEIQKGFYPEPTGGIDITYSGAEVWNQGTFGDVTRDLVADVNKVPTDPLTGSEYTYATTNSRSEYEVSSISEGAIALVPQANAAGTKQAVANVRGNYNGKMLKVSTGATTYILAIPTIISSNLSVTDVTAQISGQHLVYNKHANLPYSYDGTDYNISGGFEYTPTADLVVYSTGANNFYVALADELVRLTISNNLKTVYDGTILEGVDSTVNKLTNTTIEVGTGASNEAKLISCAMADHAFGTKFVNGGCVDGDGSSSSSSSSSSSTSSSSSSSGGSSDTINQTNCEWAGWIWSTLDVNIGSSKGDGFCISTRFGDWNSDSQLGNGGLSWNGWGNSSSNIYKGWDSSSVGDSGNGNPQYGQTRILDSEVSYNCKALGAASGGFDTSDTITGRMKWLTGSGNTYNNARSIDWITGLVPHTVGTYPHAIPALYIADCIDGTKDLTTDMTYTHINDSTVSATYASYSQNVSSSTDTTDMNNSTYKIRQKYLIAWTQQSGSHLPSAFSYINDGNSGPCNGGGICDELTGDERGEYQVACEAGILTDGDDDDDNELLLMSAIGNSQGYKWGRQARMMGYSGCITQGSNNTGMRSGDKAARFVVRP